jgi:hypothetical protein
MPMMANGGRMGYAMGNLVQQGIMAAPQIANQMGMPVGTPRMNEGGVPELDYRDEGGFVPPIGIKERADDIPAMLSNNEFVFTADAVKNADPEGEKDPERGAREMYVLMKRLENGESSLMAEIQQTQVLPAPFIEAAGKTYLEDLSKAVGGIKGLDVSKLYGPQFVAGPSALQTQAEGLSTGLGGYQPFLQAAQAATGPTAYQQYMSPYQQDVIEYNIIKNLIDNHKWVYLL